MPDQYCPAAWADRDQSNSTQWGVTYAVSRSSFTHWYIPPFRAGMSLPDSMAGNPCSTSCTARSQLSEHAPACILVEAGWRVRVASRVAFAWVQGRNYEES